MIIFSWCWFAWIGPVDKVIGIGLDVHLIVEVEGAKYRGVRVDFSI